MPWMRLFKLYFPFFLLHAGSAAGLLIRFRQGELNQILGKAPNLADIRSVDLSQVAEEPGEDYLCFLMDWYHSIRN